MASREARQRKLKEIQEIAEGWGKMIAREAFPEGPGLDVSLAEMEELAIAASRALVKGAVETMTGVQGERFGQEAPCPSCGGGVLCKPCPAAWSCVAARPRWTSRWGIARRAAGFGRRVL